MSSTRQCITLSSGYSMPLVGIGTFRVVGRETIHNVIDEGLKVGYRLIDTAAVYRNEDDIGYALKSLLPKYNLTKSDIFITTKLSPSDHGDPKRIRKAVETALAALKVAYIDLYLIHWPGAAGVPEDSDANSDLRSRTWKTLVDLQSQGLLRSIGVSNYNIKHLQHLLKNSYGVRPAVNQVECHPHFRQTELIEFCDREGIRVQAYSSLGTSNYKSLLKDSVVCRIADELNVSSARVLLKWALQQNIGIIPKAVQKVHIQDNFKLDFTINEEQMTALSNLPQTKYAWDPDNVIKVIYERALKMRDRADEIANLCINKYDAMKKTGKPGQTEWTVLAGVVLKNDDGILSVVSLATGTKCLGGNELANSSQHEIGNRLSDSHAEILARRGFLRYLYDQIDLLITTKSSTIFFTNTEEKIQIKSGVSFHFYCSQTPCGDCSIIPMSDEETFCVNSSSKKRKIEEDCSSNGSIVSAMNEAPRDIHRTGAKCLATELNRDSHAAGADYHVVGPLRTKPGRGDPTLSLSCSDKMAKWNIVGVQGSFLSLFVPTVQFETVIIGGECPFSLLAMERGLYKRFGADVAGPIVLQATVPFLHKKSLDRWHPCPSSIVWCAVRKRDTEIAVEGRKQGATKSKKACGLLVSRRALLETFLKTVELCGLSNDLTNPSKKMSYHHCKELCDSYRKRWKDAKTNIFPAWPDKPSRLQDFSL